MREEEGRTALYSMTDAHVAVRSRAARSDSGRPRPPDRTVGRRGRPIGRPVGGTARSDGSRACPADPTNACAAHPFLRTRLRLHGMRPGRPFARSGGRREIFTVRPIGSPSPRADSRNAVGFLGHDRRIGRRHL